MQTIIPQQRSILTIRDFAATVLLQHSDARKSNSWILVRFLQHHCLSDGVHWQEEERDPVQPLQKRCPDVTLPPDGRGRLHSAKFSDISMSFTENDNDFFASLGLQNQQWYAGMLHPCHYPMIVDSMARQRRFGVSRVLTLETIFSPMSICSTFCAGVSMMPSCSSTHTRN